MTEWTQLYFFKMDKELNQHHILKNSYFPNDLKNKLCHIPTPHMWFDLSLYSQFSSIEMSISVLVSHYFKYCSTIICFNICLVKPSLIIVNFLSSLNFWSPTMCWEFLEILGIHMCPCHYGTYILVAILIGSHYYSCI